MGEKAFIEKYSNSEIKIEKIQDGDLFHFSIIAGDKVLDFDEEEAFWTLYPYTNTIYYDPKKDIEIVKLII